MSEMDRDTSSLHTLGACDKFVLNVQFVTLVVGTNFHTSTVYSYLVAIMPQGRESNMAQAWPSAMLTFLKVIAAIFMIHVHVFLLCFCFGFCWLHQGR